MQAINAFRRSGWQTPYSSKFSSSRDSSKTRKTSQLPSRSHHVKSSKADWKLSSETTQKHIWKTNQPTNQPASPTGHFCGRRKRKLFSCLQSTEKWKSFVLENSCETSASSFFECCTSPVARCQGSAAPRNIPISLHDLQRATNGQTSMQRLILSTEDSEMHCSVSMCPTLSDVSHVLPPFGAWSAYVEISFHISCRPSPLVDILSFSRKTLKDLR